jgi:starch synthase
MICSTSNGVGLILIEPVQLSYFNREMLCGYPDDFERYAVFRFTATFFL